MVKAVKKFNLVIIGGGASGLVAAIAAKRRQPDLTVAVLERTFALGRKVLITGAGRCNLANVKLAQNPERYYQGETTVIKSVFEQFGYTQLINFFAELGIETYQEVKNNSGKIYPVTDSAKTIVELLVDEAKRLGVKFLLQTEVKKLKKTGLQFSLLTTTPEGKEEIIAEQVILAAGGKTYPALGANGSGYDLAQSLGHQIVPVTCAGVPVVAKNSLSQLLQKTKVNLAVTCLIAGQPVAQTINDVMFTDYGLSGTAILEISRPIAKALQQNSQSKIIIVLNFFPEQTVAQVKTKLFTRWQKRPEQTLEKSLLGFWPPKVPVALLKVLKIEPNLLVKDLSQAQTKWLIDNLTAYEIKVSGIRGWQEAEFSVGGVPAAEVKVKTLESIKVPGLYLAGEILDVDGPLGGYNLAWAWASGYVAGQLQK
ncbi:MAG: NAD(P)/FAD-dependent oxidoreductase [Candidatus Buchananbacteria bacterium]